MRKAVYTFIIGNYDTLKAPTIITGGWDYICFTDNAELRSNCWDVRQSIRSGADLELDDKKFAMKHMILFDDYVGDYDVSLSIGGQVQINCNLDELFGEHFKPESDMMICRHHERDCIYQEAEACKAFEKDDPQRIDEQMQRYRQAGYPAHNGLYATAVIGRRHDREDVKKMCRIWFDEFKRGSKRDQLSLNYALWRSAPLQISELDFQQQFFVNRKFILHPHFGYASNPDPFHDHTRFDNGVPISPIVVQLYLSVGDCFARWPNPQTTSGFASFFSWLNAPAAADPLRDSLPLITNLAAYLHQIRPDVQKAYPDLFGEDRQGFAQWYLTWASKEYDLPWLRQPSGACWLRSAALNLFRRKALRKSRSGSC